MAYYVSFELIRGRKELNQTKMTGQKDVNPVKMWDQNLDHTKKWG